MSSYSVAKSCDLHRVLHLDVAARRSWSFITTESDGWLAREASWLSVGNRLFGDFASNPGKGVGRVVVDKVGHSIAELRLLEHGGEVADDSFQANGGLLAICSIADSGGFF